MADTKSSMLLTERPRLANRLQRRVLIVASVREHYAAITVNRTSTWLRRLSAAANLLGRDVDALVLALRADPSAVERLAGMSSFSAGDLSRAGVPLRRLAAVAVRVPEDGIFRARNRAVYRCARPTQALARLAALGLLEQVGPRRFRIAAPVAGGRPKIGQAMTRAEWMREAAARKGTARAAALLLLVGQSTWTRLSSPAELAAALLGEFARVFAGRDARGPAERRVLEALGLDWPVACGPITDARGPRAEHRRLVASALKTMMLAETCPERARPALLELRAGVLVPTFSRHEDLELLDVREPARWELARDVLAARGARIRRSPMVRGQVKAALFDELDAASSRALKAKLAPGRRIGGKALSCAGEPSPRMAERLARAGVDSRGLGRAEANRLHRVLRAREVERETRLQIHEVRRARDMGVPARRLATLGVDEFSALCRQEKAA
jgi:hypothetical protein